MERGEPAKVALEIEVVFSQSVLNNVLMLLYEIFTNVKTLTLKVQTGYFAIYFT